MKKESYWIKRKLYISVLLWNSREVFKQLLWLTPLTVNWFQLWSSWLAFQTNETRSSTPVLTKSAPDPLWGDNGKPFIHLGTTCKVRTLWPMRLDYICQNPQSTCSVGEGAFNLESTPIMPNPFLLPHLLISKALLGSARNICHKWSLPCVLQAENFMQIYLLLKQTKPYQCWILNHSQYLTKSGIFDFVSKTTHHGIAFPTELRHASPTLRLPFK